LKKPLFFNLNFSFSLNFYRPLSFQHNFTSFLHWKCAFADQKWQHSYWFCLFQFLFIFNSCANILITLSLLESFSQDICSKCSFCCCSFDFVGILYASCWQDIVVAGVLWLTICTNMLIKRYFWYMPWSLIGLIWSICNWTEWLIGIDDKNIFTLNT